MYCSISIVRHNDPSGQLLALFFMLILLLNTVVNASACIQTVCVSVVYMRVCCVRLQCLSGYM